MANAKVSHTAKLEQKVLALESERADLRAREKELSEEVRVERARAGELSSKLEIAAKKAEEATVINDQLSAQVAVLESERRKRSRKRELRLTAHLACRDGHLLDTFVQEDDTDETLGCFSDPDRRICCHHVSIRQDEDAVLRVRGNNTRRLVPSKR